MSFTLFAIGKTRVRLNALFLLPLLLAFLTGNGYAFLLSLLSLALHEAAHAAMTFACGLGIEQIEIHPLGLCARLGRGALTTGDELAIAAAGPAFSLSAGIAAALVHNSGLFAGESVRLFANINTLLAFMNLLPAPPLDGSTMLSALLSRRFSERTVRRALAAAGFTVAALTACAAAYLYFQGGNFYLAGIAAVFIAIAALEELRKTRGGRAGALLRRNAMLGSSRCIDVRQVALHGGVTAAEALRLAVSGKYTRFIVLGDDYRELGALNENDLYEGIAARGSAVTLQSLLAVSIDQKRTW